MSSGTKTYNAIQRLQDDEGLVHGCLLGDEQAWSELIDKYKNLIFSIPIKYGLTIDDAADIFQAVCFSLLRELARLRQPRALAAWLIRVTVRECLQWTRESQSISSTNAED